MRVRDSAGMGSWAPNISGLLHTLAPLEAMVVGCWYKIYIIISWKAHGSVDGPAYP